MLLNIQQPFPKLENTILVPTSPESVSNCSTQQMAGFHLVIAKAVFPNPGLPVPPTVHILTSTHDNPQTVNELN